jgi:hypothetical protein
MEVFKVYHMGESPTVYECVPVDIDVAINSTTFRTTISLLLPDVVMLETRYRSTISGEVVYNNIFTKCKHAPHD